VGGACGAQVYAILVHRYYEFMMITVILLNTGWMCSDHYPREELYLFLTPYVR
jgi:hypothetical protein